MKRLLALLVAGVLLLSVAVPVAAAPVRNPGVGQWELVCDDPVGTVLVYAKGVPGWRVDATPGTPPILLRAAEWYVWADGDIVEGPYTMDSPPGLASKLFGPCLLHLYGGSPDTFDMRSEATWFQFP